MAARRKMIAGNWKMHKSVREAEALVTELKQQVDSVRTCDIVVAPPYTALSTVAHLLKDSPIELAGQEMFYEASGAFTGGVSGPMLKDVGCAYVLVGHSERRQLFGETLQSSQKRTAAALKAQLTPIVCVGESLQERQENRTAKVVGEQLEAAIAGLSSADLKLLVIAYEPVWAIGTGQVATPAQAQEVHQLIRAGLRQHDVDAAANMRILYGGSVKPDNARELLGQADIDGALVGGASLSATSFADIIRAAA